LTGTLDLVKTKGLKKSEINQLNRLLQKRLPPDRILTMDLAEAVAEISYHLRQPGPANPAGFWPEPSNYLC